ncbi:MAG TPA: DUF302 domain-containing protein [Pseudolabrys sp.]|nr:DUF302 domain-containing protein [Pseudolabrys sp.]
MGNAAGILSRRNVVTIASGAALLGLPSIAAAPSATLAAEKSTPIARTDARTGHPYEKAAARFEAAIGRLDAAAAAALVTRTAAWNEAEAEFAKMAGPSGLMLFAKFDQGAIASLTGKSVQCRLYIVGNPAVAARILRIDPRASLYVPFRVALFQLEGESDATIAFDRPSSLLGALGQQALGEIGAMLDREIDAVVEHVRES